MGLFIFQFSQLVLILSSTIFKIESMRLKFVIIAKMYNKEIENGLQNNSQIQHWSRDKNQMLGALEHPLGSPRIFEAKERGECFAPYWKWSAKLFLNSTLKTRKISNVGGPWTPFRVPQNFWSNLGTSLWQAKGGWGAQHSPHWGALDFSNFRF